MPNVNYNNTTLLFFADEQPTVLYLKDGSYQFYIDTDGDKKAEFNGGVFYLPIECIANFDHYDQLPDAALDKYYFALISAVYKAVPDEEGRLDICKIHHEVLTEHWKQWLKNGYVTRADPLPFVLQIMGFQEDKRRTWF